jgi:hypothetical protein
MADPEAASYEEKDEKPDKPEEPDSYQPKEPEKPEYPQEPEEPECPPPPPETSGCEPGVDDLTCVAAGDKAKAAYHDTFVADLAQAKLDYEETRKAYRTEQHDATPVVQSLENEIRHLVERIKCQITQKRVWKCLDDAFGMVRDEIKCCPTPDLCCEDPCEFPLEDIEKKSVAELAVLIAEYQERTDAAKQCFTDLKGEPAALKQRVEDVKTEVASLTTDLGGDPATLDLKRLYARALVVQWKIKKVWGAFGQVQKFVDCLCQALTCWTKGCYAVYQLSGAKAIAECKEQAKKDRCDKLRNETVEQVLAAYDRICAEPEYKDEPSDYDDKPDEEDPDDPDDDCDCSNHHHDCGCHHHHHHHHHKHHKDD